ncbi:MAG TPA: hypothetical protein VM536_18910 [Chloroflexia bacterium]|nr:hypothetical protein [Chloroflexia bacterium]
MRAILCLLPDPLAARWPPALRRACLIYTPRVTITPDGALLAALPADNWPAAVRDATALLSRLAPHSPRALAAGLAATAFAARAAAHLACPGRLHVIAPGQEAAALAPLPLDLLPNLPPGLHQDLARLRITTLGDLAAVPAAVLTAVFGAAVVPFQRDARGGSPLQIPPITAAPASAPVVRCTVAPATTAPAIAAQLDGLSAELAISLVRLERAATAVTVRCGFADGSVAERTVALAPPAASAPALAAAATPLLGPLLRARRRAPRWLAVAATRLATATQPPLLSLVPEVPAEPAPTEPVDALVARLQQQFGSHVIRWGVAAPRALALPAVAASGAPPIPIRSAHALYASARP